jgi:hypothetical protein
MATELCSGLGHSFKEKNEVIVSIYPPSTPVRSSPFSPAR